LNIVADHRGTASDLPFQPLEGATMRLTRRAVLTGIASLFLAATGLTSPALTALLAVQNQVARIADESSRRFSGDFTEPGIYIRSAPNTRAAVQGVGNPGDSVAVRDKVAGEAVTCAAGVSKSEWFHVYDQRTHVYGYVSGCYL
jgi:hypothetical protein